MLNLLSLFSGIGAFEKALERENISFKLVNYCEIDKYASKSYAAVHAVSEDLNLHDVTTAHVTTPIDLLTYGFPCVPAGYLIKVANGYKAIENIDVSDLVLTHTNQYKKVVKTMSRVSDHINHIKLAGCPDLQVTDEHPLYVLRDGEFMWVKAKDLCRDTDYMCYNINTKAVPCGYSDDVLWLLGRYFADGYKENHSLHRHIFCIGKNKTLEFESRIKGFEHSVFHEDRPAVEYKITDDYLCDILESLPTGSSIKCIPQWIIDLPKEQLQVFYDGYFSGDGHSRKDRKLYMFCTTSKAMYCGLQDIVLKLYNVVTTTTVRHDNRKATFSDTYCAQYSLRPKDQIIKDDKVCVRVKDIKREHKDIQVYNFEVADDNSYTVNNVIVHNCQDISQAGHQKGFTDENGDTTRSGLFFEALRIIKETQPKYAIAENVKALTSKKFKNEFETVLNSLNDAGYNNYYDVLNAKDYGVPQNRERVFIISIRKDLDDYTFTFPEKQPLTLRLKDILEPVVDEKFYLSDKQIENIKTSTFFQNKRRIQDKDWSDTLCARDWKDPKCVRVGNVNPCGHGINGEVVSVDGLARTVTVEKGEGQKVLILDCSVKQIPGNLYPNSVNPQAGRVYDPLGVSPSVDTCQGGNRMPKVVEPVIAASRGRTPDNPNDRTAGIKTEQRIEINNHGVSNTLTTVHKDNYVIEPPFRIRKLTPLECWRLMGFDDNDFYKARNTGISNSQLYKQAGNSIVVNVIQSILKNLILYPDNHNEIKNNLTTRT